MFTGSWVLSSVMLLEDQFGKVSNRIKEYTRAQHPHTYIIPLREWNLKAFIFTTMFFNQGYKFIGNIL